MRKLHEKSDQVKWNELIESTEIEIAAYEKKIGRLKKAVRVFKDCSDKGEPWPGVKVGNDFVGQKDVL